MGWRQYQPDAFQHRGALKTRLCWPKDSSDAEAWRKQWSGAFRHRLGHIIRTSTKLAEVLAILARGIRDRAKTMLAAENEHGPLTKLFRAFRTAIIHDLTPDNFADTYAQSITYRTAYGRLFAL